MLLRGSNCGPLTSPPTSLVSSHSTTSPKPLPCISNVSPLDTCWGAISILERLLAHAAEELEQLAQVIVQSARIEAIFKKALVRDIYRHILNAAKLKVHEKNSSSQ